MDLVDSLLNNKIIILLNLMEYHLILATWLYQMIFPAIHRIIVDYLQRKTYIKNFMADVWNPLLF